MLDLTYAPSSAHVPHEKTAREHELILANMGLAESIARRYAGSVGDPRDIRQVALLGLVKAARRFDPERGFAFPAFAGPTISGEIKRYLRDTGWAVRPPRRLQEQALSMGAVVPDLRQALGREPSPAEIADRLGLGADEVSEAIAGSHGMFAAALDDLTEAHTSLFAAAENPADIVERNVELHQAVRRLPRRDQHIITMRFCEGRNQREIASELGMSQMQVSRAISKALRILRAALEAPQGTLGYEKSA